MIPLAGQRSCFLWRERAAFPLAGRSDVGDPRFNLAGPFAVFRSRERDGQRARIQALLGTLAIELGVLIAHIEWDHLAGNETALIGGSEFGRKSGHFERATKWFCNVICSIGAGKYQCFQ
ncbi:MAG: hypothetical protein ABSB37_17680 [Xanthobacteraceae bacterium]